MLEVIILIIVHLIVEEDIITQLQIVKYIIVVTRGELDKEFLHLRYTILRYLPSYIHGL